MIRHISTHHKTGSIFWKKVFNNIQNKHNINIVTISEHTKSFKDIEPFILFNKINVILDFHSSLDISDVTKYSITSVHSFRSPAEIIFSATNYHLKTDEKWANIPNNEFNGLSYKEKLNTFASFEEKLEFEMENASFNSINKMISKLANNNYYHVNIDSISTDKYMRDLIDIYRHLNISEFTKLDDTIISIGIWLDFCSNHCLWNNPRNNHTTSLNPGVYIDNRQIFTQRSKQKFKDLFGESLYEQTFNSDFFNAKFDTQ
tara:strand:+ start:246 stop:1025 length:780 start_codon:yes stop_codon:yes gene_type:complete